MTRLHVKKDMPGSLEFILDLALNACYVSQDTGLHLLILNPETRHDDCKGAHEPGCT